VIFDTLPPLFRAYPTLISHIRHALEGPSTLTAVFVSIHFAGAGWGDVGLARLAANIHYIYRELTYGEY
jgi:hypothetical protein